MNTPSYNSYLTADLRTCSRCGITQKQSRMEPIANGRIVCKDTDQCVKNQVEKSLAQFHAPPPPTLPVEVYVYPNHQSRKGKRK